MISIEIIFFISIDLIAKTILLACIYTSLYFISC